MKKILVTMQLEDQHKAFFESQVRDVPEEFDFVYRDAEELTEDDVRDAAFIIGPADTELLPRAEQLEWLQLSWAGADPYVKPGVLAERVVLTNASGAYGLSVSEHMVAVTFALVRHLQKYARRQQAHLWQPGESIISVEGSRVLVLGLGDIGGSYARKMKALGAYVVGVRRRPGPKPDFIDEQHTVEELDRLLGRADIVAMVLPGGPATHHIMDERRLRLMKKGAYLVNNGRGGAIDPEALKRVLADGHLGGAALDVTEPEPLPSDDPLWDDDRVIITPHISGQFLLRSTMEKAIRICGENLYRRVHDMPLKHIVDRETGY